MPFSPLSVAALVALTASLVGVVATALRRAKAFRGYEAIEPDARALARALRGEIVRDGGDVVVRGNFSQLPTIIRFSHSETMPGLNVRVAAPATFNLQIVGRSGRPPEGRTAVRIGSELLDTRFAARTDHPTQVKLLLSAKGVPATLQRLCCSTQTLFALDTGSIELSELLIPEPYTAKHVLEHLEDIRQLAASLEMIPGAHEVKIAQLKRRRSSLGLRLALVLGAVAAIVAVLLESRDHSQAPVLTQSQVEKAPEGIYPADAALIPNLSEWRLARADDFDPAATAWLRQSGQTPAGRVTGDLSGKGLGTDVAYVLVRADGSRRLVLLVDHENRYDTHYKYIGILTVVPKGLVGRIKWAGTPPQDVEGDGVLITRKADDATSGLMIFSTGSKRITSGVPANYQSIELR